MKRNILLVGSCVLLAVVTSVYAPQLDGTGPCGKGPRSGRRLGHCGEGRENGRCQFCPFMGNLQADSLFVLEQKERTLGAYLLEVQNEKARRLRNK